MTRRAFARLILYTLLNFLLQLEIKIIADKGDLEEIVRIVEKWMEEVQ